MISCSVSIAKQEYRYELYVEFYCVNKEAP
jgi:hypothetical protein